MMHPWLRYLAALLFCGSLYFGFVSAQESGETKTTPPAKAKLFPLPTVLEKHKTPVSVEELREIEKHVPKVLQKVMPSVVGLLVGPGQGSGVIIGEDGTILTAGHVSGEPAKNATVIMRDAKRLKGKTLGRNKGIDSGMVKIGVEGKYPALEMGNSADLKVGQWVIAIGHPGGFRENRTPVVRVGRILFVSSFVIRTDCTLVGGDSGGPLFDMQGRVIGIHSRIGGLAISENMHVPVDTFREEWVRLAGGESYGKDIGQMPTVLSLGGKIVFEAKGKLTKDDPTEPCPDSSKMDKNGGPEISYHVVHNVPMKKGHSYTVDLVSSDKTGLKLDTYLRIEDDAKKELAHDDDGGGFPHSRIVFRPTKDAEYRLIATSFGPRQVGDFTLTVRDADFQSGLVDVLKAVKIPLPAVEKQLKAFSSKKQQLHIHALLVDDKGVAQPNKEVTVQWDQGKETVKSNGVGYVRWALKKENSKNLNLELPKGIRAVLVLVDQDGEYIPFGAGKDDPSVEKIKSGGGKIVKTFEGKLAKTDPFDLDREKCYRHIHEFKMQAGKIYTVDLVSDDFDAVMRLEHDDKGKVGEDDNSGGFLNSRIVFTPEKEDTFRIVVTTCNAGEFGTYRVTIREADAKPATPKKVEKK